ncbi:MAG: hypothetical protein ACT4P1_00140 [Sporichthyaceae bacterium]
MSAASAATGAVGAVLALTMLLTGAAMPAGPGGAAVSAASVLSSGVGADESAEVDPRRILANAEQEFAALARVNLATRAARGRARTILTERAEKARRAEAAEAARRLRDLRSRCGYNPGAQRLLPLTGAQSSNVRAIIAVARRMDLPPRAAVIALATAMQESTLRNISYGHLDSVGLFQQRSSAGWGSYRQIMNPSYSAFAFYRVLREVGGWQQLPLTIAAQRVQRSAFPFAYARWEGLAAREVAKYWTADPFDLLCRG